MFPLRDDNPTEIPPFFTMAIIAACVAVWVWLQGAGLDGGGGGRPGRPPGARAGL